MRRLLLISLLLLSPFAWAGTYVRNVQNTCQSTIASLAFPHAVTSGDLLLVSMYTFSGSVNAATVTDTVGTTYTLAKDQTGSNNIAVYKGLAAGSGANTVAISGTSGSFNGMCINEIYGVTGTIDATAATYSGSNPATLSLTTAANNEYIFAAMAGFHNTNAFSPGSGYDFIGAINGNDGMGAEGKLIATAGSNTVSMSITNNSAGDNPFVAIAFTTSNVTAPITPINIVQSATCEVTTSAALSCVFPSNVTSGHSIIAYGLCAGSAPAGSHCDVLSDTLSTVYSTAVTANNNSAYTQVFYGPVTSTGANTVSFGTPTNFGEGVVLEVSGITVISVDASNSATISDLSPPSFPTAVPNMTATTNNSLLVCATMSTSAITGVPGIVSNFGFIGSATSPFLTVSRTWGANAYISLIAASGTKNCTTTNGIWNGQGNIVGAILKGTVSSGYVRHRVTMF
jgi:hypothetical protein